MSALIAGVNGVLSCHLCANLAVRAVGWKVSTGCKSLDRAQVGKFLESLGKTIEQSKSTQKSVRQAIPEHSKCIHSKSTPEALQKQRMISNRSRSASKVLQKLSKSIPNLQEHFKSSPKTLSEHSKALQKRCRSTPKALHVHKYSTSIPDALCKDIP